jgi:tetratricopeptide (TPR) repeat protein
MMYEFSEAPMLRRLRVVGIPLVIASLSLRSADGFGQDLRAGGSIAGISDPFFPSSRRSTRGNNRPTPEERVLLSVSEKLRRAVVLFGSSVAVEGSPHDELHGTGFVISRARRLVATTAHVADGIALRNERTFGILDGTSYRYRVERLWYHPGLVRVLDMGLSVRSSDPNDGDPFLGGPDVAVVQLSAGGPEFPREMELADQAELGKLDGQVVGSLAYELAVDERRPSRTQNASAAFTSARIAKPLLASSESKFWTRFYDSKLMLYNGEFGPGASGAPVFLPSGRVVGIVAGGETPTASDPISRDYGIPAQRLRELAGYHAIDRARWKLAPDSASREDWGPGPNIDRSRKAARLAGDSEEPLHARDYRGAIRKCNEALALAPDYARALYQRGRIYTLYLLDHWSVLDPEQRLAFAIAASRDASRSVDLYPRSNLAHLFCFQAIINVAWAKSAHRMCTRAVAGLDALPKRPWPYPPLSDDERAFLFNLRAQAHQFLGKLKEAEEDYALSIRADPDVPWWYQMRAQFWEQLGRASLAKADRMKAEELGAGEDDPPAKPISEPDSLLPEVPRGTGEMPDFDKIPRDVRSSPK